jgi:hypothetical protein
MSRPLAALALLMLLGSAGCSTSGTRDKASDCGAGQAGPCHEAPDHSSSGPGNGGGMGHGGMM